MYFFWSDPRQVAVSAENEAKVWIIDNQKGRRNLTDGWKWELAQEKKKLLLEKGKENLKIPTGGRNRMTLLKNNKVETKNDEPEKPTPKPHNTQKELAKDLGWSPAKVGMADKVWKDADEEVKERIKKGDESIGGAKLWKNKKGFQTVGGVMF